MLYWEISAINLPKRTKIRDRRKEAEIHKETFHASRPSPSRRKINRGYGWLVGVAAC